MQLAFGDRRNTIVVKLKGNELSSGIVDAVIAGRSQHLLAELTYRERIGRSSVGRFGRIEAGQLDVEVKLFGTIFKLVVAVYAVGVVVVCIQSYVKHQRLLVCSDGKKRSLRIGIVLDDGVRLLACHHLYGHDKGVLLVGVGLSDGDRNVLLARSLRGIAGEGHVFFIVVAVVRQHNDEIVDVERCAHYVVVYHFDMIVADLVQQIDLRSALQHFGNAAGIDGVGDLGLLGDVHIQCGERDFAQYLVIDVSQRAVDDGVVAVRVVQSDRKSVVVMHIVVSMEIEHFPGFAVDKLIREVVIVQSRSRAVKSKEVNARAIIHRDQFPRRSVVISIAFDDGACAVDLDDCGEEALFRGVVIDPVYACRKVADAHIAVIAVVESDAAHQVDFGDDSLLGRTHRN